jgi:peptidyl-prolyl cis-trans isomerase B (cyclophilin B)
VSPSERDRAYERRRHEDWQRRQTARAQAQRRRRRTLVSTIGAVVAVALLGGVVYIGFFSGRGGTPSASSSPASSIANPCPAPTAGPPATPLQLSAAPPASAAQGRTWTGTIATSCGAVEVTLDGAKAPRAVASFITLAQKGFFKDTPCHRLTTSGIFVLQCGDPTGTGTGGPGYTFGPVENAPGDDVYPTGTLAMARQSGNGSSMGSQFFIVYKPSTIPSDSAGGYTVFGQVTSGLDVVRRVAAAGSKPTGDGAPNTPISIEQVSLQ